MTSEDLDFLKSLKASDFVEDGFLFGEPNVDYLDILYKWNNLQKTPGKRRNFTFMEIPKALKIVDYIIHNYPDKGFPKYAYIRHNKDTSDHIHYHFYIEYKNPRSFVSVANEFGIPVSNLQAVISKSSILQYLTHENAPDKHHYDKSEIHCNFDLDNEINDKGVDVISEFHDWRAVRSGQMSMEDFLKKYDQHFASLNLTNRIRIYDRGLGRND